MFDQERCYQQALVQQSTGRGRNETPNYMLDTETETRTETQEPEEGMLVSSLTG